MEWHPHQRKPHFQSLTDSQATLGKNNPPKALAFVTHQPPHSKTTSCIRAEGPGFQDYWTCTLLDLISSSAIIARISEAIEPLNFVGFPFASFTSEQCATGHGCFAAKQAANIFEPAKQF